MKRPPISLLFVRINGGERENDLLFGKVGISAAFGDRLREIHLGGVRSPRSIVIKPPSRGGGLTTTCSGDARGALEDGTLSTFFAFSLLQLSNVWLLVGFFKSDCRQMMETLDLLHLLTVVTHNTLVLSAHTLFASRSRMNKHAQAEVAASEETPFLSV